MKVKDLYYRSEFYNYIMCHDYNWLCFFPRRRIGKASRGHHGGGQPKLFGGSLEEYLEEINQDIPTILKSCVRVINLYGLHHHGIFRVNGQQIGKITQLYSNILEFTQINSILLNFTQN